eukprot:TRINITY_DN662_c0_g1_i1.p1 TRINITY_DN662_c0_g1~~TRINITY_DN662_c0_g1_i1.p1  ORF type:complete len:158 (-),score=16.42 TRINITY_DN662_c0_g1_i1:198-671(-)
MQFIPCKEVPKFEGSVLVLPSLAVGNVGQLAIDTLINTSSLPRVGYIDSPFILPMIANDAFDSEEGCLVTCVEVFHSNSPPVFFVQQRAPIVRGREKQYSESLVKWIISQKFSSVILLHSVDKIMRIHDSLLVGYYFLRYHDNIFKESISLYYIQVA